MIRDSEQAKNSFCLTGHTYTYMYIYTHIFFQFRMMSELSKLVSVLHEGEVVNYPERIRVICAVLIQTVLSNESPSLVALLVVVVLPSVLFWLLLFRMFSHDHEVWKQILSANVQPIRLLFSSAKHPSPEGFDFQYSVKEGFPHDPRYTSPLVTCPRVLEPLQR